MKTIYELNLDGTLHIYSVDTNKIQKHIDKIKNSLSIKYFDLESKCNFNNGGSTYREFFSRNTVNISPQILTLEKALKLKNYEYYQDILFNSKNIILPSLKVRINKKWEFRYIINNGIEKVPYPISQYIKELITK